MLSPTHYDSERFVGGDFKKLMLLTLLYFYNGIAMGLSFGSLPYILKAHYSYSQIAVYLLSAYPFTLKFFWSPLVDSHYIPSFGRRKSWIVPIEILTGVTYLILSFYIEEMISSKNVYILTMVMFAVLTFIATHDIAVDGLAIEILHYDNRMYGSSCQTIGVVLGYYISYTGFLTLNSTRFCNAMFGTSLDSGILEMSDYLRICGGVMILSGILLGILLHEPVIEYSEEILGFTTIYKRVFKMLKLSSIQTLIFILLTVKISTSAHDNSLNLQLYDRGFPKETIAIYSMCTIGVELTIAFMIGKLVTYMHDLTVYTVGFGIRICMVIYGAWMLYDYPDEMSWSYHARVLICIIGTSIASNLMFITICGFVNKISDSSMGGTSITLLMTIHNFGGTWPSSIVMSALDWLKLEPVCQTECMTEKACGETCIEDKTTYFKLSMLSIIIGVFYLVFLVKCTSKLEKLPLKAWLPDVEKLLD
jgi:PAT family acetyl-CoA transporter-like MFS transporter 1